MRGRGFSSKKFEATCFVLSSLKQKINSEIRKKGECERGKNGCKLLYFVSSLTQYGVGITTSERFHDDIKKVERFDDRQMKLTIILADRNIHFFIVYEPQTGRPDAEKDAFWQRDLQRAC